MKYLNSLAILILLSVSSVFFVSCEGDAETIVEYRDPDLGIPVTSGEIIGCWQYDKFIRNGEEDTNMVDRPIRFRENKMGWG